MLCVLRNRRKAHSNTSSTATRRGTIDSRDASLLSTVELQSRDIRRRRVDLWLREKCSVNAINAQYLDPVSNQFECGLIFGAV